jgi:phosphopantothenoylcysteine decarboxylase / phosphopantothenate---cysteine ligase
MLDGRKIVLGITGSIAAYKSAVLVRLLVKAGAEVKVVMTASASDFISPLTLATLSKNPVYSQFIKNDAGEWNNHVELGLWADLLLIAPASANTIGKMANGLCDNLLMAVYLSAKCKVFVAPAMDLDMWKHSSTQNNISKINSYGNYIIDVADGELASGLSGKGRMAEPEEIILHLIKHFERNQSLFGKKAMVTAGPTYEALDPIRFIGNHSSGKMGYKIAEALAARGAEVTLVSGPSHEQTMHHNIKLVKVMSADEMYDACVHAYPKMDISVFAAAVADYRPETRAEQKIKKEANNFTLQLVKNKDIAAELGKQKKMNQLNVGFALETENEVENAQAKLEKKNFDMIVLNSLNDEAAGFGKETNKVSIISKVGTKNYEVKSKTQVAEDIVNEIVQYAKA